MYRVVLVDDEQIILQGLTTVFPWARYECEVVGTASDGREGLALMRSLKPQILLSDIRMPNVDGLSMIAALKSEFPLLQIIVLTAFRDFDYAQRAMHLGVCRYLLKPSRMDELHEAMATVTETLRRLPKENAEETEGEAGNFVVREALKFMEEHCAEHLTLSQVADAVYVSQWHLSKLLNRCARQSFFDLVNGYRIERAKALLADPARKINEIAFDVGYTEAAHFNRSFKKITGQTPMEYRDGQR